MPADLQINPNVASEPAFSDGAPAKPIAPPQVLSTVITGAHHVFLEGPPEESLGKMMGKLRTWLDANKITPVGFSCAIAQTGGIEVQHLTFRSRSDASLFEHAFGTSTAPGEKKRA